MQIKLTLMPKKQLIIPFSYNHQLQAAIYSKLSPTGMADILHESGYYNGNIYKAFVFGSLTGEHTTVDKHFVYSGAVSLEFRSPVFEICDAFQRGIEEYPYIKLFDTMLDISDAALLNVHFKPGTVRFKANSPVVAYRTEPDGKTTFFTPESDEFAEHLTQNYESKYNAIMQDDSDEVEIKPLLPQKKIVTRFKSTWITGYKGDYIITGSGEALEFIYSAGLGSKSSQGFGLLNV